VSELWSVVMTDEELLAKILEGKWKLEDGKVLYLHGSHKKWKVKVFDAHPKSGRFRCRIGRLRRTIYKNKLVWMIANKKLVPEGFVVDHVDGDRSNDRVDNLGVHTREESSLQGFTKMEDEVFAYFEAIGFFGFEPSWDV